LTASNERSLYATTLFMNRPSLGGPTTLAEAMLAAAASAFVSSVPGSPEHVWKAMRVNR